jgi:hypothetical protein
MTGTTRQILAAIESGEITNVLSTPLSAEEIDTLVEGAKTDPGAPFESEVIARMAATKRADLAAFMRLRARLKEAKISVGELDKALAECEAAGSEVDVQGQPIIFPEFNFGQSRWTALRCWPQLPSNLSVTS